jgi:hypothetical protein
MLYLRTWYLIREGFMQHPLHFPGHAVYARWPSLAPAVCVQLPETCDRSMVEQLRKILLAHPGLRKVCVLVGCGEVLQLDDSFRVDASSSLYNELRGLLGVYASAAVSFN